MSGYYGPVMVTPYDKWAKQNADILDEPIVHRCDNCRGEKEVECGGCGEYVQCPVCEGKGECTFDPRADMYWSIVDREIALLETWGEKRTEDVYKDNPIICYEEIE